MTQNLRYFFAFFWRARWSDSHYKGRKRKSYSRSCHRNCINASFVYCGLWLSFGNFRFFFGAMYLYTINCVFICIASLIIVKYLKYPCVKQTNFKTEKRVRFIISFLTLALIVSKRFLCISAF